MSDDKGGQVLADGIAVYCRHDELLELERIVPNPRNPNKHSAKQLALLAKIIHAQGWRAPITLSRRSGYIVRGHARLEAAQRLGVAVAPVEWQEYESESAEYADLVADNRLAELANVDERMLAELLADVDEAMRDLTGYLADDIEKLVAEQEAQQERDEPEVRISPELYETHDYVVLYFDNELDWQAAVQTLGLEQVTDEIGAAIRKKDGSPGNMGLGRVIAGAPVIERLNGRG